MQLELGKAPEMTVSVIQEHNSHRREAVGESTMSHIPENEVKTSRGEVACRLSLDGKVRKGHFE